MKVKIGDLIGMGWDGTLKRPFLAVVKKVHDRLHERQGVEPLYTVYVVATGKTTHISQRDIKKFKDGHFLSSTK